MTQANIGNNVKSVGFRAFQGCIALTSVVLGSGLTSIDYSVFQDCTSLNSINLHDAITFIGSDAFNGCISLTSVDLGAGIESLGSEVFRGCKNLLSVTIHNGCKVINNGCFYDCIKLASIDIPNSVTRVGSTAFYNCAALAQARVGDGVESIGFRAFQGCVNLQSIYIGANVKEIDYNAFTSCKVLKKITVMNTTPPTLGSDPFANYAADLFVPTSAVDTYKNKDLSGAWSGFTGIQAFVEPLFLTIKQGNGGIVKLQVSAGEKCTCHLVPLTLETGKLNSVTYNGIDVTNQLVDNTYTTPSITGDSELVVNFDSDSSQGRKGDMNSDNILDASDVVLLVDEVMKEEQK